MTHLAGRNNVTIDKAENEETCFAPADENVTNDNRERHRREMEDERKRRRRERDEKSFFQSSFVICHSSTPLVPQN
jgi:hypothetical protein